MNELQERSAATASGLKPAALHSTYAGTEAPAFHRKETFRGTTEAERQNGPRRRPFDCAPLEARGKWGKNAPLQG